MSDRERVFCKHCGFKILKDPRLVCQSIFKDGFCSKDCQEVYEALKARMKGDL